MKISPLDTPKAPVGDLMKPFEFHIPMRAVPKMRARFSTRGGFVRAVTPKETRQFEEAIAWHFRKAGMPMALGPVEIEVTFHLAVKDKSKWGTPHTARPDCDNLWKSLADSANGILYRDDCQVYAVHAKKFYAEKDFIFVRVLCTPDMKRRTKKQKCSTDDSKAA